MAGGEPRYDPDELHAGAATTAHTARMSLDREAKAAALRREQGAPVERELDRVQEAVSETDTLIGELGRRLAVVLGPERPEPAMAALRGDDDLSPLTARLAEEADRIGILNGALRGLLRRIEL